jgi:hypothetical protein
LPKIIAKTKGDRRLAACDACTLFLLFLCVPLRAGYAVKSDSPEWDAVLERLAEEIKVRHP